MKDDTPESRTGIYETIDDVPPDRRLDCPENHRKFIDRDVFAEYNESEDPYAKDFNATKNRFTDFCEQQGLNPALVEPDGMNDFLETLSEFTPKTQQKYYSNLNRVYRWMVRRVDYPHTYNPVLLAAVQYPESRAVYESYAHR